MYLQVNLPTFIETSSTAEPSVYETFDLGAFLTTFW